MSPWTLLQEELRKGLGVETERNADPQIFIWSLPTYLPTPFTPKYHAVFQEGKTIKIMFIAELFIVVKKWK